jgi:hypothetical protein
MDFMAQKAQDLVYLSLIAERGVQPQIADTANELYRSAMMY